VASLTAAERRAPSTALFVMVLLIATAGLVYELAMAAVASYVLGDSVTQFSTVIGVYLSALGVGAFISRFAEERLEHLFVDVELGTALVGGLSAPGLFLAFSYTQEFRLVLYATVIGVGILVGLELPLLMRILERRLSFKELIARALSFDYAGALIGSLGFSLVLVPHIGLTHTSILCGLMNATVGLASTWVFAKSGVERMTGARIRAVVVILLLLVAFAEGKRLTSLAEAVSYGGNVVFAESSAYQRIVLAEREQSFQLYLNGNLQFSSADERRYHEALVHPALLVAKRHKKVLIGGGGDGLAAREVLRWPDVESITLVDLDHVVTDLARRNPKLVALNGGSLSDPRLTLVNGDAMVYIARSHERFDVVILDFPDPNNFSVGKLYSAELYRSLEARLAPGGALVVQSTSPLFARHSFWCVVETLESVGFTVLPYRVFVPSFGEWGFALAKLEPFTAPTEPPPFALSYLDRTTLRSLFELPRDSQRVATRINRLDNQALVGYYAEEWRRWE
jgi:spermidine synthase